MCSLVPLLRMDYWTLLLTRFPNLLRIRSCGTAVKVNLAGLFSGRCTHQIGHEDWRVRCNSELRRRTENLSRRLTTGLFGAFRIFAGAVPHGDVPGVVDSD